MKVFFSYIFISVLLALQVASAQTFVTKVSAHAIGKRDQLQVDYVAENLPLDEIRLPEFKNWLVVSGPNFSSSKLQTGNVVSQQTVYTMILAPKATGTLSIPGALAITGTTKQQSNGFSIVVKNIDHVPGNSSAGNQPSLLGSLSLPSPPREEQFGSDQVLRKGENSRDKIKNNILIKLDVNKTSYYVGEPILATYKLCTRLKSESKVVKQPTFTGCTVVEMTTDELQSKRETINGRSYNAYLIRQVQLFPLQAGKLVLPQTSVENKIDFYKAEDFNYRDMYYNNPSLADEQVVTISNPPKEIEIKPLPEGAPATFTGAVGRFIISTSTDTDKIKANETIHLNVSIMGEGNLQETKAPAIEWPAGLEGFDATEQVQTDKTSFPVRVAKVFSYPFVVNKVGRYTIPSIVFTYLDASKNAYITTASQPLTLVVTEVSKKPIFNLRANSDDSIFTNRLYLILGLGVVVVIFGLVFFQERNKKSTPAAPKNTGAVTNTYEKPETDTSVFLFGIRELQPERNSSNFYKLLCQNLHGYVSAKYNGDASKLESVIINQPEKALELEQLQRLLKDCNLGMYTPVFTVEEAMQHRLEAIEVLTKLEKV